MEGKPRETDYAAAMDAAESYWNDKAAHSSTDCERVEWSRRGQLMRFETFLDSHDVRGKAILDVGCGVGDLFEHLRTRGAECEYVGFDLSPAMIVRCRERFPGVPFESGNFLGWNPRRSFDYVVSIGIHNIRIPQGAALLRECMRRQFEMCTQAAYLSLLTDRYQGFAPHIQAWRAEEVLTAALEITPYVALRHDYLPNDFSVALYRRPMIDTRSGLILE
jgi:SAM-dependent methyltransferase